MDQNNQLRLTAHECIRRLFEDGKVESIRLLRWQCEKAEKDLEDSAPAHTEQEKT